MSEGRKSFFMFRPRFILFCLYVAGYFILRHNGEIVRQTFDEQEGGIAGAVYSVQPVFSVPYWRRQVYRAFFSPLMVTEEEVLNCYYGGEDYVRGLLTEARDYLPH